MTTPHSRWHHHPVAAAAACLLPGIVLFAPVAAAFEPDTAAQPIVAGTNALREADGLAPLASDATLTAAARSFARYMARTGRYGHGADGRTPAQRAGAEGYEPCIVAENIGYQYRSDGFVSADALAGEFVRGWRESPGHRRNMLDAAVQEIGVAVAQGEGGHYFGVQLFGRPKRAAIRFEVRNATGQRIEYSAGENHHALAPRQLRVHLECRPVTLTLARPARGEPFSARAADGTRYIVREDGVVRADK